MKKIINTKVYDTDTATRVGKWYANEYSDLDRVEEELYRKRTGEYFLYGCGGARSKYSEYLGGRSYGGGERIMPLTYAEAQEWAEEHLSADAYETEFGEIQEDDTVSTITVSMPSDMLDEIRRDAKIKGTSVSSVIVQRLNEKK